MDMDGLMNESVDRVWMDGRIHEETGGWMDGQIDRLMDGLMKKID